MTSMPMILLFGARAYDQTRLYVNPACALLGLEGQEDKAVEVELFPSLMKLNTSNSATGMASKSLVKGCFNFKSQKLCRAN